MNRHTRSGTEREVSTMYQIYGLLGIMVLLWGITIWASIPEEDGRP